MLPVADSSDTASVVLVATLLGGATALLALGAWIRRLYRRTLGRRRDHYERLSRLGTGVQLAFFESVLGQPPAIRHTVVNENYVDLEIGDDEAVSDPETAPEVREIVSPRAFVECFFIDRTYYVQTFSDGDGTVIAYSVTTRQKRFRPIFEGPQGFGVLDRWRIRQRIGRKWSPLFRVELGKTTFPGLHRAGDVDWQPSLVRAWLGARAFSYSEAYYYGNPGYYQTYVFTASGAAFGFPVGNVMEVTEELGLDDWPPEDRSGPTWPELEATQAFRRKTAVTTFTVIGPHIDVRNYPGNFGPHGDEVRTVP
jgi:hypothetical protein